VTGASAKEGYFENSAVSGCRAAGILELIQQVVDRQISLRTGIPQGLFCVFDLPRRKSVRKTKYLQQIP